MNWYDYMTLAIIIVVTVVQSIRGVRAGGFGLPLFESAGVVVAAVLATAIGRELARQIHVNEGTVMFALFVVLSIAAFVVARYLFALTALTFQSLDGVLSVFCGVVMGWAVAHMFLRIMMGSEPGQFADTIASSPVAREIFQFRTWNALMRVFFKAQSGQEVDLG
jgi:uncharacterized membrane protein required for colicin V production